MKTKLLTLLSIIVFGTLMFSCDKNDDNENDNQITIPTKIQNYLDQNFPSSTYKVLDFDQSSTTGNYEVDVINIKIPANEAVKIEIVFSSQQAFLYYQYEVKYAVLPPAVSEAFTKAGYTQSQIEDINYRSRAAGLPVYIFDLKNVADVVFDQNGNKVTL